jgi:cob(I)alamin adenosyltransferase
MVRLDKIYTKGGDSGQTSLSDGSRVSKTAPRIAAIGAVDETNSAIGIARLDSEGDADAMLARIQNDLFDLGADLSMPEDARKAEGALRITPAQVERLEREIDAMNESLSPLTSFVLPRRNGDCRAGGTRDDQQCSGEVCQPPVRSFVRDGAASQ